MDNPPFAIFYAHSAYSTDERLMGRQMAGKSLVRGLARTWRGGDVPIIARSRREAAAFDEQMRQSGFKGRVAVSLLPSWDAAQGAGCLYYPAPILREIADGRDAINPTAFSLMGVTHTLSGREVMDCMAEMVLPPFQPWDALICTSTAARSVVAGMHAEMRDYWRATTGASRFNEPLLPVIPLGIHADDLRPQDGARQAARTALELNRDEVAFLFTGRLAYHAKANPAPLYQALQRLAATRPVVCIEAGIHPNDQMREGLEASRRFLAPSVRTIWVDGSDQDANARARAAADVFVSLADNIQESFGLTPLEAMAAGLPVVVSDWDGYKDTVRHGVDGFRIPTVAPAGSAGIALARQYHLGLIGYDQFIGGASLATFVDTDALYQALEQLAGNPDLRRRMGLAGQQHVKADYDWPIILARYADLAAELGRIRTQARRDGTGFRQPWPTRGDPFQRFSTFPTTNLKAQWRFRPALGSAEQVKALADLPIARFGFNQADFPATLPADLLRALPAQGARADEWLAAAGMKNEFGIRALMWLWKFGLVGRMADPQP